MYTDIHDKIEKGYGAGNGDYELYDECNLYELVPERLPVNRVSAAIVKGAVGALVKFINVLYNKRPYQRFYFLETVARVPYFSFISVLQYKERIGVINNDCGWL